MIPQVEDDVDGCPDSDLNVTYMTLSAFIGLFLFVVYQIVKAIVAASRTKKMTTKKNRLKDAEFRDLQLELYGPDRIKDSMSSGGGGSHHNSDTGSSTGHAAGNDDGLQQGGASKVDEVDEEDTDEIQA
jgi:hypothetical protein